MKIKVMKNVKNITPNWDEKYFVSNAFNACADVASVDERERALVERSHRYACDEASVMMQIMRNLIKSSAENARVALQG